VESLKVWSDLLNPHTKEQAMTTFQVDDMSCGHCVNAITQAVHAVDAGARIDIDLGSHLVRIEPASASPQALGDAIREAGYTPVPVTA
jgi:copper chaperone